jgi:branched-chain amino acid transport system substrate-binding protein
VSCVSTAEPIRLGYLFDFDLPDEFPRELRDDLAQTFEPVFAEGRLQGLIRRSTGSRPG